MMEHVTHTFTGMNKDISKGKYPNTLYYDAKNIKLFSDKSQSTLAVSNQRGPKLIGSPLFTTIYNDNRGKRIVTDITALNPIHYTSDEVLELLDGRESISIPHQVIGYGIAQNGFVLFTTSDYGADGIWFLEYLTNKTTLLYLRRMNFSKERPIQAIVNYETESIEKVYWVDGENQLRFLNIRASVENGDNEELINLPVNNTLSVSPSNTTAPEIINMLDGGNHTAGMVQYAYTLYKLNGSQSKLSPLSELIALGNNGYGGDVNEIVSKMPQIKISDIDTTFSNIRVYSIKYTTLNATPSVNLIYDSALNGSDNITIVDAGNVIQSLSISEIAFAGNDLYIPKHIASKDNRLFISNYKNLEYKLNIDTRAYAFSNFQQSKVYDNIYIDENGIITGDVRNINNFIYTDNPDDTHDSINIDHSLYKYDPASAYVDANIVKYIEGGRGKYLYYQIKAVDKENDSTKGLKDDEIYRIAIRFRNKYGQKTQPMWVADFKSPAYNFVGAEDGTNNKLNTLHFGLTDAFYNFINSLEEDDRPVGYEVLMAERNMRDRTILSSGIVGTSMLQKGIGNGVRIRNLVGGDTQHIVTYVEEQLEIALDNEPLLPTPVMKNTMSGSGSMFYTAPSYPNNHLENMNGFIYPGQGHYSQIALDSLKAYTLHWQHDKLMFQYSPELIFSRERPTLTANTKLRVKGAMRNTYNSAWLSEKSVGSGVKRNEAKVYNGISTRFDGEVSPISGNPNSIGDTGLFDHPGGSEPDGVQTYLFYRKYGIHNNTPYGENDRPLFARNTNNTLYTLYGIPEYNTLGESFKSYNGDFRYRYANNLKSFTHGPGDADWDEDGIANRRLLSYNVNHQSSIAFMMNSTPDGESDPTTETNDRIGHNLLHYQISSPHREELGNSVIYCEFVKEPKEWLFSGIYGGNTYEERLRTHYVQMSKYVPIVENDTSIKVFDNCGDTYVQNFKFLRMAREDTDIQNETIGQFEEIVEFPVETSIDLSNRNDYSRFNWDNNDVYLNSDYHNYNTVYSQNSNVFVDRADEYTTRYRDTYNTTIRASKLKHPGELVDSWVDILSNEEISLDGKYGGINHIVTNYDRMYAFQDSGISHISVNPRIQIQGNDGIELELGTGGVLHDYTYITTDSGSLNKWSILPTYAGIYYFDTLNNSINVLQDKAIAISDVKGLKTHFNNIDLSGNIDNPLIGQGVVFGYSPDRGIVNASFNLPNYKEVIDINASTSDFISRHTYAPNIYMTKGDVELVFDSNLRQPYQMYKGLYNNYFGKDEESSITLLVSDNSQLIKVMDNIKYKMEAYDDNNDQPFKTLSKIRVYNEYQDSGYVNVAEGRRGNARRRFRDWNVMLPRDGRDRIRNSWNFIELVFSSDIDKDTELILHDVTVSYTV